MMSISFFLSFIHCLAPSSELFTLSSQISDLRSQLLAPSSYLLVNPKHSFTRSHAI